MPKLVRMYIINVLIGFAISAVFVGGLIWLDVAGLGALIQRSDEAVLAVVMMWVMNGIVFAGVQFAWAVMNMAEKPKGPRGGTPVSAQMRPVPVAAKEVGRG